MRTERRKHTFSRLLMLCLLYAFSQTSCATSTIDMDTVKSSKGWIDNNTYAIIALGRPIRSLASESKQKNSAKRAALINARFKILKRFKRLNRKESIPTIAETQKKLAFLIKKVIKNGKIVYENFDHRNNCEIIYTVQHKNLKEIVKSADLSIIDVVY